MLQSSYRPYPSEGGRWLEYDEADVSGESLALSKLDMRINCNGILRVACSLFSAAVKERKKSLPTRHVWDVLRTKQDLGQILEDIERQGFKPGRCIGPGGDISGLGVTCTNVGVKVSGTLLRGRWPGQRSDLVVHWAMLKEVSSLTVKQIFVAQRVYQVAEQSD